MGLDQYLNARKYISRHDLNVPYDPDNGFADTAEFANLIESALPLGVDLYGDTGASVSVNVGYWRKAYAIHDWFASRIENTLQESDVPLAWLFALRDQVNAVLADNSYASQYIPDNQPDAFAYSENYYDQLRYTQKLLEHLTRPAFANLDFTYRASW